jgi:hypothetical protein
MHIHHVLNVYIMDWWALIVDSGQDTAGDIAESAGLKYFVFWLKDVKVYFH